MTVDLTQELSKQRVAAKAALAKKGLELPKKPDMEIPQLPSRLTDLTDRQLMRLLALFTRFQDFVAGQHAEAEIDEQAAETKVELLKAKFLVGNWTGSSADKVTIAKAEAATDPEVQKAVETHGQLKAKRKLYGIMLEKFGRDAAVLSRELSRRIGRESVQRRVDRHTP